MTTVEYAQVAIKSVAIFIVRALPAVATSPTAPSAALARRSTAAVEAVGAVGEAAATEVLLPACSVRQPTVSMPATTTTTATMSATASQRGR